MKFVIIFTTYYSLGSRGYFQSDNNASACTDRFCDNNVFYILYSKHILKFEHKPSDRNGWTLLVCETLYGEKYIYIVYVLYV